MSDFFEDELVEENSEKSEESTEEEKKIKHKKLWPKIVAAVLCLCVLVGGTIIIEKVIPKKDKNKVTSNPFSEFEALKVDENDVSFINIKNENGEYKLYSEKDTSAQSDANA